MDNADASGLHKTWDKQVITCADYDADYRVFTPFRAPTIHNAQDEITLGLRSDEVNIEKMLSENQTPVVP